MSLGPEVAPMEEQGEEHPQDCPIGVAAYTPIEDGTSRKLDRSLRSRSVGGHRGTEGRCDAQL